MSTEEAIKIMKLTIKIICEGYEEPITICECHKVIDCLKQQEEEHPTPLEELKLQAKIFNDVLDGEVNKGYPRINFRRDQAILSLFNELPVIIDDIYKKLKEETHARR